MWRNLITTLDRSLAVTSMHFNTNSHLKWIGHLANVDSKNRTRSLASTAALRNTGTFSAEDTTYVGGDADHILPYRIEFEKRDAAGFVLKTLRTRFRLSPEDVERVRRDGDIVKSCKKKSLMDTLDVLTMEGFNRKSIVENPWIITVDSTLVMEKTKILKTIKGMRDLNDFASFLRVKTPHLSKVVAAMNQEANNIICGNRVYYTAEKLDVPACLVSKYLSKRLFVFYLPFDMFKSNLQHMIDYNIDTKSLLKDLWAFRYAPRAVEIRLRRAQQAKKNKIMPWMVRCPESVLQKTLKLTLDELKVLDNKSSVAEYIGERLGFSPEDAQAIMNRHPQVNRVRVTKIKEVLDYLMIEEKFSGHEIAQVPRVLCHSLKTTKQRIEELKKYNCRPSTLIIVCRSQREYEKFLNAWIENYNKFETVAKNDKDTNKENQQ